MALGKFERDVLQDIDGDAFVLEDASVEVRREDTGALASLFSDPDGATPITNPFTAAGATVKFYADSAYVYRIEITDGVLTRLFEDAALEISAQQLIDASVDALSAVLATKLDDPTGGDPGDVLTRTSGGHAWAPVEAASGGAITLGTPSATTSGTTKLITGIPSTAQRVTLHFIGVTCNFSGDTIPGFGLKGGPSGGIAGTYNSTVSYNSSHGQSTSVHLLTGDDDTTSTGVYNGSVVIELVDAANFKYIIRSQLQRQNNKVYQSAGIMTLTAALERLEVKAVDTWLGLGSSSFTAGSMSISYE